MFQNEICSECSNLLLPYMIKKKFKKNHLFWQEGEKGHSAIYIKTGVCKVYKTLPDGRDVSLFLFGEGKFFGFLPFLDEGYYPASVKALSDVEASVIKKDLFLDIVAKNSEISLLIMKSLAATLRKSLESSERLTNSKSMVKIASLLYSLNCEAHAPYNIISLPVTSKEYSELLAITPETFSRGITTLQKRNIIKKINKNIFQIVDIDKLKNISEVVNL